MRRIITIIYLLLFLCTNLISQNSLYTTGGIVNGERQIRKYDFDSTYAVTWTSDFGNYRKISIGDVNNDGENDLVVVERLEGGQNILIYSITAENTISVDTIYVAGWLGISNIVTSDVDKDGENELLIQQFYRYLLIYSYENSQFNLDFYTNIPTVQGMNVGDADNDEEIEIIVALDDYLRVFSYNDSTQSYSVEYTIPSSGGLNDCPVVADVDNDGENEVVCGGNYNLVRVWEFDGISFEFMNEYPVSGASQGLGVGDVDGDLKNEIVVGTAAENYIYVLGYEDGNFELEWSVYNKWAVAVHEVEIGDCDNDGLSEIITSGTGLKVYKYDLDQSTYNIALNDSSSYNSSIGSFSFQQPWEYSFVIKDSEMMEADTNYHFLISVQNLGASSDTIKATIVSDDLSIIIDDSTTIFYNFDYYKVENNYNDPYQIRFLANPQLGLIPFRINFSINDSIVNTQEIYVISPANQFTEISTEIGFKPLTWNDEDLFFTDMNKDRYSDIYLTPYSAGGDGERTVYWGSSNQEFSTQQVSGPVRALSYSAYTDINNDNLVDIYESNCYVPGYSANILYIHTPPEFINITSSAGVGHAGRGQGVVSYDYNNDGYLDIFLTNGIGGAENDVLYQNNGDQTYTNVSSLTGITYSTNGQHVAVGDINNDGLMDIFVSNYNDPCMLLLAEWDEKLENIHYSDITTSSGIDLSNENSLCTDLGDLNNDGYLDILITGYESRLYLNNGDSTFSDISSSSEIDKYNGLDIILFDFDHDGFMDIFLSGLDWPDSSASQNVLLKNNQDLTFTDVTFSSGLQYDGIGKCAASDFNNDGQIDIAIAGPRGVPTSLFFYNKGNTNNWLSFHLIGELSNSLGIGSRIELWSSTGYQIREVNANLGNDVVVNFGLAEATLVDSVYIHWPSGLLQVLKNIEVNKRMRVIEGRDPATTIEDNKIDYPDQFYLSQNFPNPFNPSTTIKFNLPKSANVRIDVYNLAGQKVESLLNTRMSAGNHKVEFNAQNLSSGIYFYRIDAGEFQDVKKMILIK